MLCGVRVSGSVVFVASRCVIDELKGRFRSLRKHRNLVQEQLDRGEDSFRMKLSNRLVYCVVFVKSLIIMTFMLVR